MSKDLAEAAREVSAKTRARIALNNTYGKRIPSKQERLAKLIIEIGIDSAQVVFEQTRARLERIT